MYRPLYPLLALLLAAVMAHGWRSSLYPVDWTPPGESVVFNQDMFLQDFSHAGYGYGEIPLPWLTGPVIDVTQYGADPSGTTDSTPAIQAAINVCEAMGGGVVYLPEGLYAVAPSGSADYALKIDESGVVLRGAGAGLTRILNTSVSMRQKAVLRVDNGAGSWINPTSGLIPIVTDLLGPTTRIPVTDVAGFSVGESIVIHADATPDWIIEHQMDTSTYWLGQSSVLGGVAFYRDIVAIEPATSTLVVDTPIRYFIKVRDNARVYRTATQLTQVGVEHLSIGNVEHPGTSGWSESDWNITGQSAYDVHASWLITFENVRHGWIRGVHSFAADGNVLGSHMLSNGILVRDCRNVTVRDCDMQKVQYGGGGGNGYTYRFQNSQEILMADSAARYQRHGIVQSHMRNSGNVFHRVLTQETKKQTAGSGRTNGSGSDHHMHFSQSMLFDMAVADRDFYDARWRAAWGTVAHGLTSTSTAYWNSVGWEPSSVHNHVVRSDQFGYGYVIGTSGTTPSVSTGMATSRTAPEDFVEGVGTGETLEPASLYRDQFLRRTGTRLLDPVLTVPSELRTRYTGTEAYALLTAEVDWGMDAHSGCLLRWTQVEGPVTPIPDPAAPHNLVHLPVPGTYRFQCRADNGWFGAVREYVIELRTDMVEERVFTASGDTFVRGAPYNTENYGTATNLPVKWTPSPEYQREAYFMFPVSIDPIEALSARIEIFVTKSGEEPPLEALVASPLWEESTLTWDTRPGVTHSLGTYSPVGTMIIPVAVADLNSSYLAGTPFSLVLRTAVQTAAVTNVASRESADPARHPRLVLEMPGRSNYLQWAEAVYGTGIVNNPLAEATVWGRAANPDRDRLVNAHEFTHGTNALTPSGNVVELALPALVRFPVAHAADLPVMQWSSNLADWNPVSMEHVRVTGVDDSGYTVEVDLPDSGPNRYLRLSTGTD